MILLIKKINESVDIVYYFGSDQGDRFVYTIPDDELNEYYNKVSKSLSDEEKIDLINEYSNESYDPDLTIDEQFSAIFDEYASLERYDELEWLFRGPAREAYDQLDHSDYENDLYFSRFKDEGLKLKEVFDIPASVERDRLTPPEYDEPEEVEPWEESIEFSFKDVIVTVTGNYYEYENSHQFFSNPDDYRGRWASKEYGHHQLELRDSGSVAEDLLELIPDLDPGRYKVSGEATLVYRVSGVLDYGYYDSDSDWEPDYNYEDCEITFLSDKSTIEDFKAERLD